MAVLAEELRDMPLTELKGREDELRREIFDLKLRIHTDAGSLARYREARKELARCLTVQRQKQQEEG